ncbi:MAG: RimK family alpha-L-glutamate ligase [Flavobacteriales bacterium]|jgi:ribosomal protein S6--L-glutamate ligase
MLIYILSRNRSSYSTSRLQEAALKRGHTVQIIDHSKCELKIGTGSHIYYQGKKLDTPDFIIPRIGASSTFIGSNVVRQFEMMKVKTVVTANGLLKSRDKLRASQNLVFSDIEVPKTYFPSLYQSDIPYMMDQVNGVPLIIKHLESTQGLGVFLAETEKDARQYLDTFNRQNIKYLIQEYISESKGKDVRAFVVGGKVVASMKRTAPEGEFRSNIHRGGVGMNIKLTKEEEDLVIKTAKVMNLTVCGVDLLQSDRGPLILEVNSSPGLEGIEKYTQVDVAGSIIEHMESKLINQ